MGKLEIKYPKGATPLSDEELQGLLPDYITTREELNELEQKNIQAALLWLRRKHPKDVLVPEFTYDLHKRMFGDIWRWAGKARATEKNIGIDPSLIATELWNLLSDTRYWIVHQTYSWDEIAVRFHHRLVKIHIFPNGNGRHSRLITDLLLEVNHQAPFTWGSKNNPSPLEVEGKRRQEYIQSLIKADKGDYQPLIHFVRS